MRLVDGILKSGLSFLLLAPFATCLAVPATLQDPQAVPGVIPLSQVSPVRFSISVVDPDLLAGGLTLVQLDSSGKPRSSLGRLVDNGTAGDLVANDGVYSLTAMLSGNTAGTVKFAVTAAFRGRITRMFSPAVGILVSDQVPTQYFATESANALIFRNAAGTQQLMVPLPNSTNVVSGKWQEVTSKVRRSDFGECAIVFSQSKQLDASVENADQPEYSGVSATQYCNGALAWQRTPPSGFAYFHDAATRLISSRGSAALLVGVPVDATATGMRIEVVSQDGAVALSKTENLNSVLDAGISSNGRYVYLTAHGPTGALISRFYDVPGGQTFDFAHDAEVATSIEVVEIVTGSFSVLADGQVAFTVP